MLALALLTARGATQEGPFQLHQRPLQAVASDGPTNVPCGALQPDTAGGTTTTWSAMHSPYILPLNTTNDPNQPSSACGAFPLPGESEPNPLPGVLVNPGSTLVIDASLGPVQIFSHGAGITVNGGTLKTVGTGFQNGSLNSVTFDAEPDVASWDGIQILKSDSTHLGNASFGYTAIGHALTSITITSGATSTADPSGNTTTVPFGLALFNSAIGPSYFDGIDVTDTPISFIGEQAATNGSAPQPQLADGKFGTVNNIGSQGINLTYDTAAPANSAGIDIEGTAFGSSIPFGDTTCPPLSACAAGTIGNSAIQASFAQAPVVPVKLVDNRFYRAGSYGVSLSTTSGPQITNNLFDCNGSGTPKPLVTPCTGNGLKYSAIYLNNATVDLENKVTGNTGQEDGLDAVVFNGTVTSPTFTWKNATNDLNNQHSLGYLVNSGMAMNGGTFAVPSGSVVKVKDGAINLNNTKLDASDGGAKLFTSLRDNTKIASCPSVFVQSCPNPLPAGEWTGIDLVGSQAAANLNNASILYPTTGVSAQGAGGITITQTTAGTSNIGPTFADGITAVNTPVSVSHTTFGCPVNVCTGAAIGDQGISADYATAGGTLPGALTLKSNTFQSSVNEAVVATGLAGQPVDIETNFITNAGGFGINLQRADHLTLLNNTISNSGTVAPTHSAIYLNGISGADFGALISGNVGTGNGLNAIVFHGSTATPLAWQTVGLASATSQNPLGYMLDGDLTVGGSLTLNTTDPLGDYVPVLNGGKITVNGLLTGTNATFTSFKEHSRIPTCGSVFVPKVSGACQAVAAGDWGGLVLTLTQANTLTGGEIRYATTGITLGAASAQLATESLVLSGTNIRNTVADGVHSQSPISVTGGSFVANGGSAINVDLTAGGVAAQQPLQISNTTVSGSGGDGILATHLNGEPVQVDGNVVDHSGGYGIDLKSLDTLTGLTNNTVTNAAKNFAAIYLDGYNGDFANQVSGNKGASNGLDALAFHGTVTGDLTWQTAHKTSDPTRPLGYLLDNSLSMQSGKTLTVNAGDIVKVGNGGSLLLDGVTLRADGTTTSAQKIFTSLADNTAGVAACPSQLLTNCTGPAAGDWGGINLSGSAANGTFVNTAIRYAGTGISISNGATSTPTSSSFGLVVSRSTINSSQADAVDALNTPLSVTDSTITGGVRGVNANITNSSATGYLRLSGNRFMSTSAEAILGQALSGQPVWITDNHIQSAGTFGIRLLSANALVLRNNNISGSGGGPGAGAGRYPAIYLGSVTGDFVSNIRGNVGSANGLDALAFDGKVTGDLSWKTPSDSAASHPLGYIIDSGMQIVGTLQVHPQDVVKAFGAITINGGELDASTSGLQKIFTSLKDNSDATRSAAVSCPSVFVPMCNPSPTGGDWGGLVITANGANVGTGNLVDAVVDYADTAISIDSGPFGVGDPLASTNFRLRVSNGSSIDFASKDGINSLDTPIYVDGSTIQSIGGHGIVASFFSPANCSTPAPPCSRLTITNDHITATGKDGIIANGLAGEPTFISDNVISNAATYGIRLVGADLLGLTNNSITKLPAALPNDLHYPSIYLSGVKADFEPTVGTNPLVVAANSGSGTGLDAVVFHGEATNGLTWQTPGTLVPTDQLGYVLDGALTVDGTLTANSGNDVVKILNGGIKVNPSSSGSPGSLNAVGAIFTSLKDSIAGHGLKVCSSVFIPTACPTVGAAGDWSGINIDAADSHFDSSTLLDSSSGITMNSAVLHLAPGSVLAGISGYAITTSGTGSVQGDCVSIHDDGAGIHSQGGSGSSLTESNFKSLSGKAVQADSSGSAVTANHDWWDTATPTLNTQYSTNVTVTNPLPVEPPTFKAGGGSIAITSDDVNATTGYVGKGTLTVTLTSDRELDPNSPFVVNFLGPAETVPHPVIGTLQSDHLTWIGHAAIDPGTNIAGLNTLSVSAVRSCIADGTNTMPAAETANFTIDFGMATVAATGGATNVGSHSATITDSVNPNGWSQGSDSYVFFQYRADGTPYAAPSLADIQALIANPTGLLGYKTIGHGNTAVPVSVDIPTSGTLSSNQLYHYRTIAVDLNGITIGAEQQFTTTQPASKLIVTDPPPITAGTTVDETTTAEDPAGLTVADYTGPFTATTTDPQATWVLKSNPQSPAAFPANVAFGASDHGVVALTVTFKTAGSQTFTAHATGLTDGTQSETVAHAAASNLGFTTSPQTTTAGVASGTITVQQQDAYGNAVPAASNISVTLSTSNPSTGSFLETDGTTSLTNPTTILTGDDSTSFTYEDTHAGSVTLTAKASGLADGTQAESVTAATPTKLAFTTSPQTLTADAVSGTITVEQRDTYNNPSPASSSESVTLTSTNGSGNFFETDGTTALTSPAIATGNSNLSFKYGDTVASSPTITAHISGLTDATQTETVNPGTASQLSFTTFPQTLTAGGTSGLITVQQQDDHANPVAAASSLALTLITTSGAGSFFETDGTTPLSGPAIASGDSSFSFKYSDTVAGTPTITAQASGLIDGTQAETVNPATATKLAFSTPPRSVTAGTVSGVITVQQQDTYGNAVTAGSSIALTLTSGNGSGSFFETDGTTSLSSPAIASGDSGFSFKYSDTLAGPVTLTAQASGLTDGTQSETVVAAAPTKLVFTTSPQTFTAGSVSGTMTVEQRDTYDNPSPASSSESITLTSTSLAGRFFETDGTTVLTSPSIASSASSLSFKYGDTAAGTPTLTAAATGLADGTQTATVSAGAAAKLGFTTTPQTLTAGSVSGTITVQQQDTFGNAVPASSAIPLTLTSTSTAPSFFETDGTTPLASPTIASGDSSLSFKYGDTVAGAPKLTAQASGLSDGTQVETVNPGAATQLVFTTPVRTLTTSTVSDVITVEEEDAHGNAVPATSDVTLTLTTDSLTGTFYETDGITVATSPKIATGDSGFTFRYGDTTAGTPKLTASASGLTDGTQTETVN